MNAVNFIEDLYTGQPVMLTGEERILLRGLLGSYTHMMLLDLRNGSLTETGIRDYRRSLAEAGELMGKLGGVS
jgi:hypothetical protein